MGIQPSERKCGGGIRSTRESASPEQIIEGNSFGLSRRAELFFEKAPLIFRCPARPRAVPETAYFTFAGVAVE